MKITCLSSDTQLHLIMVSGIFQVRLYIDTTLQMKKKTSHQPSSRRTKTIGLRNVVTKLREHLDTATHFMQYATYGSVVVLLSVVLEILYYSSLYWYAQQSLGS